MHERTVPYLITAGVVGVMTAAVALQATGIGAAQAEPKVFVCKYVGTPGVDEVLQTGQNPISVSLNAIPGGVGVGDSFADAQGRSLVIAFDTGQSEPQCPGGPTPTTVAETTTTVAETTTTETTTTVQTAPGVTSAVKPAVVAAPNQTLPATR